MQTAIKRRCRRVAIVLLLTALHCGGFVSSNAGKSTLTPADVLNRAADLEGKEVTIAGTIRVGRLITGVDGSLRFQGAACTRMACSPANPCCNTCSSGVSIVDGASGLAMVGEWQGKEVGCHGNDCEMICNPQADVVQTLSGRIVRDANTNEVLLQLLE